VVYVNHHAVASLLDMIVAFSARSFQLAALNQRMKTTCVMQIMTSIVIITMELPLGLSEKPTIDMNVFKIQRSI
jgi:hypothetical protein